MTDDIWSHRDEALADEDLIDFDAVAPDGRLGNVSATAYDRGHAYLVIELEEPGGRAVVVPAGMVEAVDLDDQLVRIACPLERVREAPRYDAGRDGDPDYVEALHGYWGEPEA